MATQPGLDPTSDEASWRYLTEVDPEMDRAIAAVKRTNNRHDAVRAFHDHFERSGDIDSTGRIVAPENWNDRLRYSDRAVTLGPAPAAQPPRPIQQHRLPPDHHADAAPINDGATLVAEVRMRAGRGRPGDEGLLRAYREQQNRPAASPYADEDHRSFAAQQRDAERAVLPRRASISGPADVPERDVMTASLGFDHSSIREAIHHVRTLKAELASLGTASVSVRHSGFGHQGDHAPGAVRMALNGRFGSDGRAFS